MNHAWLFRCPPCKKIAPAFSRLSNQYKATFLKVDVDEVRELSTQFNVRSMPTFKIIVNGTVKDELLGASEPGLVKLIEKYAEKEEIVPEAKKEN